MTIQQRWINLIHTAATGARKTRTLLTPVGILVFGTFTVVFVFAGIAVDRVLGLPHVVSGEARLAIAIPLIVVGAGATAWSVFHFLKEKGTPVPFNPPPGLVTTGPYRYARNPMLTGVFLMLLGIGFAVNSISIVLIFTPLYILLNIWELKRIEEPELVKRLGAEYIEYRGRTPMFIPGWRVAEKPGTDNVRDQTPDQSSRPDA